MKTMLCALAAAAVTLTAAMPAFAFAGSDTAIGAVQDQSVFDRRKPRVPGGSGCDDPRDLIEHPECRG